MNGQVVAEAEVSAMILDPDDAKDAEVHPTAIVEEGAELGEGVRSGPSAMVGQRRRCWARASSWSATSSSPAAPASARAPASFPFASIGHQPQDLKYKGEPSTLTIGSDCMIREGVTMNPAPRAAAWKTMVGERLRLPRQHATSAMIAASATA